MCYAMRKISLAVRVRKGGYVCVWVCVRASVHVCMRTCE